MLMKNWTVTEYNPDYFWDFEDATIENMTSDGSVSDPTFTKTNTPARFDISEQYYGMWPSDNAFFNNSTGFVQSTNSTLGDYLDNGNYAINFFIEFSKHGVSGTKNLLAINFASNSLVLQLLGTSAGADAYKLRVTSGGNTLLTSTQQHWSYAASGAVVSGGFLSTPTGWTGLRPAFMMVTLRQSGGNIELYINGSLDVSTSFTAPSGAFTNFRIGSDSVSVNFLMDQLSVASSSTYTATNLATLWDLFLLGEIPVDAMTTSSAIFADPTVVITSPDVTYVADSMDASSDFINPFPEIAEINPADVLLADCLFNDPLISIEEDNSENEMTASAEFIDPTIITNLILIVAADPALANAEMIDPQVVASQDNNFVADEFLASADSGNHLYSWYHVRRFNRRDKIPSGTDAIYDIVNVFSSQNLWFYQAQIDDDSRITSTTPLYFKPELSGIASGSVVKALIKLPIKNFSATSGTSILDMYRTTGAWSLNTIINSNQPAASLVTNDYSFSWTSGDFHYIDVTELYNNLSSNSNTGFYISLSSGNPVYFDLESFGHQFQLDLYLNTPPVNAIIAADPALANAEVTFGNKQVFVDPALANAEMMPTTNPNALVFADPMLVTNSEFPTPTNGIAEIIVSPAATAKAYMYYLPLVPLGVGTASGVSRYTNVYHRVLYSLNSHTVNHVDQETDSYWLTVPDTSEGNISYIQQRTPAGSTIRQPIYLHWFSFAKSNANYASFINLGVGPVFAGDQAGSQVVKVPLRVGNISYRGNTDYIQYPSSGFATKPFNYEDTGPGNTWQFKFDGESYLRIPEAGQSDYGTYLQNYMTGSYYGSYEMTIRTDQNNCVLGSVSQSIKATVDGTDIFSSIHSRPSSKDSEFVQAEINSIRTESPYTTYTDRYHNRTLEYAYLDEGDYINYASSDQGRNYGDIRIVDGKIAFYHKDRLSGVETLVLGTTLINDLNNHHIIVNRTVDGFGNMNQADKNKKSRLELWVDGNLEAISYEINDKIWLNRFSFLGTGWSLEKSGNAENGEVVTFRPVFDESQVFTGYMQDYICRSNRPLTEIEIQRLARARFEIIAKKTDPIIASSSMPNATVTTNAKTILRLYWDIDETRQNGLSFTNNNYNIYTYNVLKTTYNKPSELFNLDQNFKNKLQELEEVSAITNDYVYLSDPSVFLIDPGNVANQFALGSELVTTTRPRKYHQEFLVDGVIINTGDRFAVTGQTDPRQNGLYVYNGRGKPALRTTDSNTASKLTNCYFYVRNGNTNKNTYWTCVSENITKRIEAGFGNLRGKNSPLIFKQIYDTEITESSPIYDDYYRNGIAKTPRFIDVNNDIEFDYDIITFINYPTNSNELLESIPGYDKQYVSNLYKDFINNLITAAANGKNIFVNSPMLTQDLGIATNVVNVPQTFDTNDTKSQSENLFDLTTSGSIHFDNYRNNKYQVVNTLSGLTNQSTYIMTDFVNYIPEQSWLNDQYHIKYTNKTSGLSINDEYIIPTLPVRSAQLNLIKSNNQIGSKDIFGVLGSNIIVGTPITTFGQNYWVNNTLTSNPYKNYVTTIAVNSGSVVKGITITGKIFVNLVEDGLTAGREDYNYAILQDVPNTQETAAKRLWQYSTSRLRKNKKYVLEEEAYNIQRLPSNSGGGPIVQMPTNITDGTIRNNYDIENGNAYSTEYNNVENELYTTIKVPCLSMSYMGLKWLGG